MHIDTKAQRDAAAVKSVALRKVRIPVKWGTDSAGCGAASERSDAGYGHDLKVPHFSQEVPRFLRASQHHFVSSFRFLCCGHSVSCGARFRSMWDSITGCGAGFWRKRGARFRCSGATGFGYPTRASAFRRDCRRRRCQLPPPFQRLDFMSHVLPVGVRHRRLGHFLQKRGEVSQAGD